MIARSMVKPAVFWLRKKGIDGEKLIIWLRIRQNINIVEVADMDDKKHNEFEYDEEEIRIAFDIDLIDETLDLNTQIKNYLIANKTKIKNRILKRRFLLQNIEAIEKEID